MEVHGFLKHNEGFLVEEKTRTYLEETYSFCHLRFLEPYVDDMSVIHTVSKIRHVMFYYGYAFDIPKIYRKLTDLQCSNFSFTGPSISWLINDNSRELEALTFLFESLGFDVEYSYTIKNKVNSIEVSDDPENETSDEAIMFIFSESDNTNVYDNITREYLGESTNLLEAARENRNSYNF